jgi:hypothetical protein
VTNVIDFVAALAATESAQVADTGRRVVLVSDPHVTDEESGWHCYGPFPTESAVMVADDMRVALDEAGLPEVQVRLVAWMVWPEQR